MIIDVEKINKIKLSQNEILVIKMPSEAMAYEAVTSFMNHLRNIGVNRFMILEKNIELSKIKIKDINPDFIEGFEIGLGT